MYWIDIDDKYLDFLREFEKRIPFSDYGTDKMKPFFFFFFYLKEFSYVKYFVPIYYVEKIVNSDVGNCEWKCLVILLMLVSIYSVMSMILGQKKFEKSDI